MLFFLLKGVAIPELKINEGIRAKKLLVIAPDGVQIGELELKKALIVAEQLDLDLVEVSPESKPPVARLMDYGKYKYELAQKAKESKKKQVKISVKEIQLKPKIDTRYDKNKIVSHDKKSIASKVTNSCDDIVQFSLQAQVVGIDEAQFFDNEIVKVCNQLANSGKRVIVAGLDMDFRGKPFGPMPYLLAIAEYVTKVHAVCSKSGKMASYTHRIIDNDELILLGDIKKYQALSRKEFLKSNLSK